MNKVQNIRHKVGSIARYAVDRWILNLSDLRNRILSRNSKEMVSVTNPCIGVIADFKFYFTGMHFQWDFLWLIQIHKTCEEPFNEQSLFDSGL